MFTFDIEVEWIRSEFYFSALRCNNIIVIVLFLNCNLCIMSLFNASYALHSFVCFDLKISIIILFYGLLL